MPLEKQTKSKTVVEALEDYKNFKDIANLIIDNKELLVQSHQEIKDSIKDLRPSFQKINEDLQSTKIEITGLSGKIKGLSEKLGIYTSDFAMLEKRVSNIENTIGQCTICAGRSSVEDINQRIGEAKNTASTAIKIAGIAVSLVTVLMLILIEHVAGKI